MMSIKEKLSKKLAHVLRHEPESLGIELDNEGFTDLTELIKKLNTLKSYQDVTLEHVLEVVRDCPKQRYHIKDGQIRANQGHSILTITYDEIQPPDILLHGTSFTYLDNIMNEGLTKQSRHHVHFTTNETVANSVGQRHGKPVVLIIDAKQMHSDGYKFYVSKNDVYLTNTVPPKYITIKVQQ